MSTFYFETVAKQSEKLANNGETFKLISETAVNNYKDVIAAAAVAFRLYPTLGIRKERISVETGNCIARLGDLNLIRRHS